MQTVKGCKIEFTQQPVQTSPPREHRFSVSETKLAEKEIKDLESKGAVSWVPPVQDQFISNLFLVKKKDGKKSASNKSEAVEWLSGVSVLQNGRYFSPERSVETKRLDSQAGSEGHVLMYQGLREVSSLQVGKLHKGIQLPFIWIRPSSSQIHKDIQASSSISPKEGHAPDYVHRRHNNPESESTGSDKGQGYSDFQSPVFGLCDKLGEVTSGTNSEIGISLHVDRLCNYDSVLPERKLVTIIQKCQCLLSKTVVTIREVSELISMLSADARAVLSAPLHYWRLQMTQIEALLESQSYNSLITLPQPCREELNWWIHNVRQCNGKSVTNTIADLTVTSDASKVAWGASCGKVSTGGFWNKEESEIHINILELTAAEFAL